MHALAPARAKRTLPRGGGRLPAQVQPARGLGHADLSVSQGQAAAARARRVRHAGAALPVGRRHGGAARESRITATPTPHRYRYRYCAARLTPSEY